MKELLYPYIGRGTSKNFKLVPLGGGGEGCRKIRVWGGVGERKDMKHVNDTKNVKKLFIQLNVFNAFIGIWRNFKLWSWRKRQRAKKLDGVRTWTKWRGREKESAVTYKLKIGCIFEMWKIAIVAQIKARGKKSTYSHFKAWALPSRAFMRQSTRYFSPRQNLSWRNDKILRTIY